MKIKDVAQIFIGILTTREIANNGNYNYKIFNIKNYDLQEQYETVKTDKLLDDKLTRQGDILVRLVYPNRVVYINEKMENLLVPSQMCVIRVDKDKYSSDFLKWYLESDLGKEKLLDETKGSSIQKISVSSLKEIEIPDLSLDRQKKIADLISLWCQERDTLQKIIINKDKLYNSLITEIIEKEG